MTTRQNMNAALNSDTPETTPLTIYSWMMAEDKKDTWQSLIDQGLGICHHCHPVEMIEHGVEDTYQDFTENGKRHQSHTKTTPIGSITAAWTDGWQTEHYIKEPQDYLVMKWIVENTELVLHPEWFEKAESEVGDNGLAIVTGSRSPAMCINVDWAGTEQFCLDVALEVPELFELYEARRKQFVEECKLIATGPGRFVKWFENLTISMIGVKRYEDLLLSVYNECVPILSAADKRVIVHYDGALSVISEQIAGAPFHIIESLTEPPEGDMTYDQCRAAWPDKAFWANINVECYSLPHDRLRAEVEAKHRRAGKQGLVFEISEDLPRTWEQSIPVVLDVLRGL